MNFLQGIQFGQDPKHTQIVGTCKHFVANSMEKWYNYSRHNYDAKVSKADLADYYFPAFKACVMEGKAMSIMCSCESRLVCASSATRCLAHMCCARVAECTSCNLQIMPSMGFQCARILACSMTRSETLGASTGT